MLRSLRARRGDHIKALHRQDPLAARGRRALDAAAVAVLTERGPAGVRDLQTAGAEFDLDAYDRLTRLAREAAPPR